MGITVLVGWSFDIAALKSILPGWVSMKTNTAVGFILIGIALWLTTRPPATFNPKYSIILTSLGLLCGLLAGLIGALTLVEYIFGWNIGIDQWLFREPTDAVGTSYLGRMSPETALSFVLLAVALWITGGSRKSRWVILAVSLGLLVTALALTAMLSYLTPGLGSYGWFGLTIMAMHTAILLSVLGIAVIAINWRQDILPWSLSNSTTAAFALGLLLLVFIGFNTNRSQFWLAEVDRKIAYSEDVLSDTGSLLIEVIGAQAHARGYVITGDKRFQTRYLEAEAKSYVKLEALRKLIANNPHQPQPSTRIEAQVKEELNWFQQAIINEQAATTAAARNNMIRHGDNLLENLRITFDQIEREHQQLIGELKQESKSVAQLSYIIIFSGMFASLLIFLTAIFRLNFTVNEKKRAEGALRKSTDFLLHVVENTPARIFWKDRDLCYLGCNTLFAKDAGYFSPDELIGKTDFELVWKSQAELYRADEMAVMESGIPKLDYEEPSTTLDGSTNWLRTSKVPLRNEHNQNIGILGIYQDITKWKRAEDSLRKLSLAVEQSPNAIVITDLAANIEYVNEGFIKVTGYSRTEVIGQNPRILQSGKTPKETYRDMWAHLKRGEVWKGEFINLRKDGSEYVESVLMNPVRQADGQVTHYMAIKENITLFKQAQEALREKEFLLLESQRIGHMGSWRFELTGRLIWSEETYRIYGVSPDTFTPNVESLINLIHPDDRLAMQAWNGGCLAGKNMDVLEFRITRPDGQERTLNGFGELQYDDFNNPSHMTGIVHDITERKQAEELLKNMAAKFHALFELSADAVMLLDEKGFFDCNPATLRLFGCPTRDDFISKHPAEFSPLTQPGGKDSMNLANEHIATATKNGSNLFEWMHRRFDGTDFPAEVLLTSLELDGKPVLQGTVRDITRRKQVETKLADQLEELRRWRDVTAGREERILDLKHEVNELLGKTGKHPRYASAEFKNSIEE